MLGDAGKLPGIIDGTGLRIQLQRVARAETGKSRIQQLDEIRLGRLFDNQPRSGNTDLSCIPENPANRGIGRRFHLRRISKHDIGRFAAKFQIAPLAV
ncbi:MAG: Uncharacterised protein [SAR116 cluster bacterium]|nr:MAG: Uncharacterised protein [SAR116 cluster bacterium]